MSISHLYPDFGGGSQRNPLLASMAAGTLEDTKLDAFEQGYKAGWDDSSSAHDAALRKGTLEVAQSIQDMSFTYQEAYSKLALALKPVMTKFVTTLMPEVARNSLGSHVMKEVSALIEGQVSGAIEIAVSPQTAPMISEALSEGVETPFALVEEPLLNDGQVYVRLNEDEREINLDGILVGVSDAIEAFFHHAEQEAKNDE